MGSGESSTMRNFIDLLIIRGWSNYHDMIYVLPKMHSTSGFQLAPHRLLYEWNHGLIPIKSGLRCSEIAKMVNATYCRAVVSLNSISNWISIRIQGVCRDYRIHFNWKLRPSADLWLYKPANSDHCSGYLHSRERVLSLPLPFTQHQIAGH